LPQHFVRSFHKVTVVPGFEVDVDVTGERAVLVAEHRWTAREGNVDHLLDGNLRTGGRADQDSSQFIYIVAEIPIVSNVDRVPLAALDVLGDLGAADAGGDGLLHVRYCQPVARRLFAVQFNVQIEALRDALGKN